MQIEWGGEMATITIRMSEEDTRLIRQYAKMTGTTVSQFVRQAALDRIEAEYDRSALTRYLEVAERGEAMRWYLPRDDTLALSSRASEATRDLLLVPDCLKTRSLAFARDDNPRQDLPPPQDAKRCPG